MSFGITIVIPPPNSAAWPTADDCAPSFFRVTSACSAVARRPITMWQLARFTGATRQLQFPSAVGLGHVRWVRRLHAAVVGGATEEHIYFYCRGGDGGDGGGIIKEVFLPSFFSILLFRGLSGSRPKYRRLHYPSQTKHGLLILHLHMTSSVIILLNKFFLLLQSSERLHRPVHDDICTCSPSRVQRKSRSTVANVNVI